MNSKLLLVSMLVLFFAGAPKAGYELGSVVEDFTLKNVNGKEITLSEYGDNGAIVIFDCNTCPYSKAYLERIKELDAMYSPKGYPVVAVNSNDPEKSPGDTFEKMVEYADENEYKHAYLYDEDQSVAKAFGATNTPHVFVIKKEDDKLVLKYIGAIDNNTRDAAAADKKYVQDAVDALLDGKNPETTKTKAIGCTIKWAS
ncbi:MAG: thioredoxin family protein [Fulvivirga sp.]|uniref:thioredoxin family protein n=1 Tax=Fulvivirga sp. TaxID=1931237 RepID=UPI0032EAB497